MRCDDIRVDIVASSVKAPNGSRMMAETMRPSHRSPSRNATMMMICAFLRSCRRIGRCSMNGDSDALGL